MTLTERELLSLAAIQHGLVTDDPSFVERFTRVARLLPGDGTDETATVPSPQAARPAGSRVTASLAVAAVIAAVMITIQLLVTLVPGPIGTAGG